LFSFYLLTHNWFKFSDFIPTVPNKEPGLGKEKNKTGMIVGIVAGIGVSLLGVITVISVQFWRRRKKTAEVNKGIILLYFCIMFKWIKKIFMDDIVLVCVFCFKPFSVFFWLFIGLSELMGIIDRPDVFSYAELRAATDAFDTANILGQGGYGLVYKVPSPLYY
jgi:hypothetical protein